MMAWLQITSARGPEECCYVVFHLMKILIREAKEMGFAIHPLSHVDGEKKGTLKSVLLSLEGKSNLKAFTQSWEGSIQWIGKSMFRPNHKRKNWFAGVNVLTPPKDSSLIDQTIRIDTMRASGPGGQHTNKNETAVRVTHISTGINAIAQEERSQHLNKKLALARLHKKLKNEHKAQSETAQKEQWQTHNTLERGNPIRTYKGERFVRQDKTVT